MTTPRLASLPFCAALLLAGVPAAHALQAGAPAPTAPDLAAAAAAGPVSTAAYGARCIGAAHDDTAAFQAAIDTGHTVYAPALGGRCHLTAPLVMKTPGQIIGGDGRARTRIVIEPGFSGQGVFVARTGEPGPVWRDFSVSFVQPDTDDRAKLTRYPPAFYAQSTPRFEMDHLGCYVATTCIDMKGNSGGATVADLQFSAFEVGIDIDGSLDTVRVTDPHWYPFQLSKKQQALFLEQDAKAAIALHVGRSDDFILTGGLFLGGVAMDAFKSPSGKISGVITTTDFDQTTGIQLADGVIEVSSSEFIMGQKGSIALQQSGGDVAITTSTFAGPNSKNALIVQSGGNLAVTGSHFELDASDISAIQESGEGARLALTGNFFSHRPGLSFSYPIVELSGGRSVIIGNTVSDKGLGTGSFIAVHNDNHFNKFIGNASPGWSFVEPVGRKGVYLFN